MSDSPKHPQSAHKPTYPSSLIKHLLFPSTSPRLNMTNLSRFLSSTSGLDKTLMLIQYPAKFIVPLLLWLAGQSKLRGVMGKDKEVRRILVWFAGDLGRLSGTISDTRTMMRLLGIISLLPSLPTLLDPRTPLLETLQLISLLIYYPLENLTYLSSHNIFKLSPGRETRWSVWSCRAWAGYVGLEFLGLWKRWEGLKVKEREVRLQRSTSSTTTNEDSEKPSDLSSAPTPISTLQPSEIELRALQTSFMEDLVSNLGYAPLTIHWSLYSGLWVNPAWTGVFGTVACLAGIRRGWRGMGEAAA